MREVNGKKEQKIDALVESLAIELAKRMEDSSAFALGSETAAYGEGLIQPHMVVM